MKRAIVFGCVLLLTACAGPARKSSEPTPEPMADDDSRMTEAVPEKAPIQSKPLKYLVGRSLKPMPDKALEVKTKCSFHDVSGGRGTMDLHVAKAEVKRFVAEITIPKQGLCRFDMKNFRQTERLPNVVLTDETSGCVVHMWEQGRNITVAFNSCAAQCGGDAFSYLWPILVDARNGRCS